MGAWHTGIYDNDTALDFMGKVTEYVATEMTPSCNEEVLVVADMMSKYLFPSPLDSVLFINVIKEELDRLENWKEEKREERKEVLLKLLKDSTSPYINKEDNTIIYPLVLTDEGDFIVQFFSKGVDMKEECFDIDYVMKNYAPMDFNDFTITIDGLDNKEVQEYLNE